MSEPASTSSGIAGRYAQAVFDLARQDNALPAVEADVAALERALAESADLRLLVSSAAFTREEQGRAVTAVGTRMGLGPVMLNTLGLLAAKRRLFALPQVLEGLRARIAEARGEVAAEVVSAQPLTAAQERQLVETLSASAGRAVRLQAKVDPSLIGGLVVRLGSRMIDTSIQGQLGRLQGAMRAAG